MHLMIGGDDVPTGTVPNVRRDNAPPDCRDAGRAEYHEPKVVIGQALIGGPQLQRVRVKSYSLIKEMQSNTIRFVPLALLRVEVVVGTSVVLVNVVSLDEHPLHG